MNRIKLALTGIAILLMSTAWITKEDPFLTLLKRLEEYTKRYPTEKIHLQLDKPYYAAGDNIWFKAYAVDARTSQPTSQSNILYVELVNEIDSMYQQLRLPMENGISWGDFQLTDTLVEGNYRIRAYTQLMRNAGPDFFFDKVIKIGSKWTNRAFIKTSFSTIKKEGVTQITATFDVTDSLEKPVINKGLSYTIHSNGKTLSAKAMTSNTGRVVLALPPDAKKGFITAVIDLGKGLKSTKTVPIKIMSDNLDIQFLPEGGNMVEGIASKIALKVIDANGKGVNVQGVVIDDRGEQVTNFQTAHLGMGSFYFNPMPGRVYTAKVKHREGSDYTIPLPKASASGYLLSVNTLDTSNINVKVALSADLMNSGDLNLIAHRDGMVYMSAKVSTAKQLARITMPRGRFPSGIVQLTLFSPQHAAIAERLIFIRNEFDNLAINLPQLKKTYGKKEKVAIEMDGSNPGSFSVAVTNSDVVVPDEEVESNILTSILLTGDLRGYIEKPNYYFIGNDSTRKEHLDYLLLTQGWRKIDWKTISGANFLDYISKVPFQAEKSIRISGVITKDRKPLANSKISLMSNKNGIFLIDTLSDKNGRFAFEGLKVGDPTKFLIQARSEKDKKNINIELDLVKGQQVNPTRQEGDIEVNVNQAIGNYLKKSTVYFDELNKQGMLSKTIQLKQVNISGRAPNLAPNSLNLNGPGVADQVIDVSQLWMANSVAKYLQGRASGIVIQGGRAINMKTFKPTLNGTDNSGHASSGDDKKPPSMHVILDGMDMGSTEPGDFDLNQLNPQDIESIELLTSLSKLAVYGPSASRGLIIITSKKSAPIYTPVKYAPGVITYNLKGYANPREFYSPKYDVAPSDKPDLRTTVFWKPNLVTDEAGKIKLDYFNTDQAGNYRIVIEGFDTEGNLARKTYTYKVD